MREPRIPNSHTTLSPATAILLAAVAAAFGLMYYYTVIHSDDLRLMLSYTGFNSGKTNFDAGAYSQYIMNFIREENARLANMLFPIVGIILPRWIAASLMAALVSGYIWLTCRLAADRVTFSRTVAVTFLSLFLLPWRDSMFLIDMGLNYVLTSALYLLFIIALMRLPAKESHPAHIVAIAILAAICGWMHEAFAAATGCAMCAMLFYKKYRRTDYYVILAVFAVTSVCCLLTPGTLNRIATQGAETVRFQNLPGFVVKSSPVTLTCGLITIGLISKRLRAKVKAFVSEPVTIFCLVVSAVSLLIALKAQTGHRPYWYANTAVIVIWCRWIFNHIELSVIAKRIMTSAMLVIIAVFMVSTVMAQIKASHRLTEVLDQLLANRFRPVYCDIATDAGIHHWGYVTDNLWADEAYINDVKERYRLKAAPVVFPSSMRHADWYKTEALNPEASVCRIGDQLFVRESALNLYGDRYRAYKKFMRFTIDGNEMVLRVLLTPVDFGGPIEYFWIRPERKIDLEKVRRVENLSDPT